MFQMSAHSFWSDTLYELDLFRNKLVFVFLVFAIYINEV